jgi:hypothetical protein
MSRRLIIRQQVIDCGEYTCGRCEFRSEHGLCMFWDVELRRFVAHGRAAWERNQLCKNADATPPKNGAQKP